MAEPVTLDRLLVQVGGKVGRQASRVRDQRATRVHLAHDRRPVEGVGQRPAKVDVVHRRSRRVGHERRATGREHVGRAGVVGPKVVPADPSGADQVRYAGQEAVAPIEVAGQQLGQLRAPCRGHEVNEVPELDVQPKLRPPPVGVDLVGDLARAVVVEQHGPGAHRVGVGADDLVGRRQLRPDPHRQHRLGPQVLLPSGIRGWAHEMDGDPATFGHRPRAGQVLPEVAVRGRGVRLGQVDRKGDVCAREGATVVPLHAAAHVERIGRRAGPPTRRREPGDVLLMYGVVEEERLVQEAHRPGCVAGDPMLRHLAAAIGALGGGARRGRREGIARPAAHVQWVEDGRGRVHRPRGVKGLVALEAGHMSAGRHASAAVGRRNAPPQGGRGARADQERQDQGDRHKSGSPVAPPPHPFRLL